MQFVTSLLRWLWNFILFCYCILLVLWEFFYFTLYIFTNQNNNTVHLPTIVFWLSNRYNSTMESVIEYLSKYTIEKGIWKQIHGVLQNKEFNVDQQKAYINGMFAAYATQNENLNLFPIDSIFLGRHTSFKNVKRRKIHLIDEDENDESDNEIGDSSILVVERETCSEDEMWNENTMYKETISTDGSSFFFRIDKIVDENRGIVNITWLYTQEEMITELVSRGDILQSQKIKREYGAHFLWISTHKQKGYQVCGELEMIQDKITFDETSGRRSMRGRYQMTELFDVHTLIRHVISQEDNPIDWKKRFNGLIENLLSRGTQMGTSAYTTAMLLELLKKHGPDNMVVEPLSHKQAKCEVCGDMRNIKNRIIFSNNDEKNSNLEMEVGTGCLAHIILAHKMCHYKRFLIDPQILQEEHAMLIGTK